VISKESIKTSTPSSVTDGVKPLRQRELAIIESEIKKVGAFGEVHLVIERGRIRFIRTITSQAVENTVDLKE